MRKMKMKMKMKTNVLLAMTTLMLAAAERNKPQYKMEDILSAVHPNAKSVDAYRNMKSMPRSDEINQCLSTETSYYDGTAISSANFPFFYANYVWDTKDFDLQAYFRSLNFASKCTALGGDVVKIDIKVNCESPSSDTYFKNFKFCKPPSCNDFEYHLLKDVIFSTVGESIGCDMGIVSDILPSMECTDGLIKTYQDTLLKSFAPESYFEEGGSYLEDNGHCKDITMGKKSDIKVCNIPNNMNSFIDNLCTSEEIGGELYPLDITFNNEHTHRTIRRYPFCKPKTCKDSDVQKYYDYISGYFSGENYRYNNGLKAKFKKATVNSCDENTSEKAFIRKRAGKNMNRTCEWVSKRTAKKRRKYCSRMYGADGFEPAKKVCTSTCCTCEEKSDNIFLREAYFKDGYLKTRTRTCQWLKDASKRTRKRQCAKKDRLYTGGIGGYPTASLVCPETCGKCK